MIPEDEREFGEFGKDVKPVLKSRKKQAFWRRVWYFCILALIPFLILGWQKVYSRYLENNPPHIELVNPPYGIGLETVELEFEVVDSGAGIDEVVVRSDQGGKLTTHERFNINSGRRVNRRRFSTELKSRQEGFAEGVVSLRITAFDRSFWSNKTSRELVLKVDYQPPRLEPLSLQHNLTQGGAGLVIYRVFDGVKKFTGLSGVRLGNKEFPGFRAKRLDSQFENMPEIHFAFFAIPVESDPDNDKLEIFAKDFAGNIGTSSLNYRIRKSNYPRKQIEVSAEILESKKVLPVLYDKYVKLASVENPIPAEKLSDLVERYKAVNVDYRAQTEVYLFNLLSKPKPERLWFGRFQRPLAGKVVRRFGTEQSFTFETLDAGSVINQGTAIHAGEKQPFASASDGIVVFAGELGAKGKTIVVDHGFGISTLYSNLSEIYTEEGARVIQGDVLGKVGWSGLLDPNVLNHEIRVHGVAVRPEEWWDSRWLKGHFENKVSNVKRALGLKVIKKLE